MVLETLAAVVRLGELVALDHRAHRAVEDEDARLEGGFELLQAGFIERKWLIAKGRSAAHANRAKLACESAMQSGVKSS